MATAGCDSTLVLPVLAQAAMTTSADMTGLDCISNRMQTSALLALTPPRPAFVRKASSVTNLIEAYASSSASPSPRWSRDASLGQSVSKSPSKAGPWISPKKDSGFGDTTTPTRPVASTSRIQAPYSDSEAGPSSLSAERSRPRKVSLPNPGYNSEGFRSIAANKAATLDYKQLMSKPAAPAGRGGMTPLHSATSSPAALRSAARMPLSPTNGHSAHKLKQRSDKSGEIGEKHGTDATLAAIRGARDESGALRSSRSHERMGSMEKSRPSVDTSPKKLIRRASNHRLRKDSGTAGHSRSPSLSRLPTTTSFARSTSRSDDDSSGQLRPDWLDQDPTITHIDSHTSSPLAASGPRRKPSLYRRLRNQTNRDNAEEPDPSGFPIPSPMTEIARSTPGATVQSPAKASGSSSLLSSLGRKLSQSNLAQPLSKEPPPLPAGFDYFSRQTDNPASNSSQLPHLSPATSIRKPKHRLPPPVLQDFIDPFTSREIATAAANTSEYRLLGRTARSKSEPTRWEDMPHAEAASRPSMPETTRAKVSAEEQQLPQISETASYPRKSSRRASGLSPEQEKRPRARAITAPASPQLGSGNSPKVTVARRPSDAAFGLLGESTSISRSASSTAHSEGSGAQKPPPSPCFQRTMRSDGASGKIPTHVAHEEHAREARFLELLSKSDSSTDGMIKLSLTSNVARDVF